MTIRAGAVIIPARNEEALLPHCLASVRRAVAAVEVPTHVVVALDSCTDGTARVVAEHPWVIAVSVDAGRVGVVRAAAVDAALARLTGVALDEIWLATTDADSRVPHDWLAGQLALAADGWDVVAGTVAVDEWLEHPAGVAQQWSASYLPVEHHGHVHGANFGCTAAAYVEVGGWPAVAVDEDVALLAALSHKRVVRTATLPVVTSARHDPRASGGFGDHLRDLAG